MGNGSSKSPKKEKKMKEKEKPMAKGLVRRKGERNPYKWGFEIREEGLAVPYWGNGESTLLPYLYFLFV